MNCTQLDQYLDAMLDGTLTADELSSVDDHCQGCAACAEKLKANRQMMRVFAEMAPEMDVPLPAQARWREAVRNEARRPARLNFRLIGGIAAALVVALGATFALKAPAGDDAKMLSVRTEQSADAALSDSRTLDAAPAMEFEAADDALIEADGAAESVNMAEEDEAVQEAEAVEFAAEAANLPVKSVGAPMREIGMVVDDVNRVCDYARDLAQEYEGDIDIQHFDEDGAACANLYIDLPAANAPEFLEAMRHFDHSGAPADAFDVDGETSLLLVLRSE
ncbi:MAG: hypothetical protein IJH86_01860 [Clostridia bacterium]|nr:hypothetical protein [Clostridia bacterium]